MDLLCQKFYNLLLFSNENCYHFVSLIKEKEGVCSILNNDLVIWQTLQIFSVKDPCPFLPPPTTTSHYNSCCFQTWHIQDLLQKVYFGINQFLLNSLLPNYASR